MAAFVMCALLLQGHHDHDYKSAAYKAAKHFVKLKLKAPVSAIFPAITKVQVFGDYEHWTVRGYVDAQNQYGAWLRTRYEAKFDLVGTEFRLYYVKLE